ncbi:MAG: peptidase M20 [Planctomycetaceae bacterium]|nr:peptidase M20 [Planctomycetaceae bacterium]
MSNEQILKDAQQHSDWIINLRRTLHKHPELMYEEVKTSQLVRDTLDELGISYQSGLAETGVLASIGSGDGPCVGLRADMDALPIHEETDVPFRSEVDGKMRACGHDCHTAMLLGAARLLKEREADIKGTVKLLFQPAEEGGAGGKRMSDEGALDNPNVERIFGLHVWPQLPSGSIGSRMGTFLAAAGEFDIIVKGKGGHAAFPHFTVDPVTTSAKVITDLQTIVSRETDPLNSSIISVTKVHAGEAYNVIPESVHMAGTIRALTMDHFNWLQKRITEAATHIAAASNCEAEVKFPGNAYPPTINDGELWGRVQDFAEPLIGGDNIHEIEAVMGGEDFAFYTERIPGVFVALGIRNEELGTIHSVHNPLFKVDESVLSLGSALHVSFAFDALNG